MDTPGNYYVTNAALLIEIDKSKALLNKLPPEERDDKVAETLTPELVRLLMLLVDRTAMSYRWSGYTWNDDMKGAALMNLCRVALKFNRAKATVYPNPFAYYTTIINRQFITIINTEKQQGRIRDAIIEESDTTLLPSYARQFENETNSLGVSLDGTSAIPNDPYKRRRRKKMPCADGSNTMDDDDYQKWLDKKKEEFAKKSQSA